MQPKRAGEQPPATQTGPNRWSKRTNETNERAAAGVPSTRNKMQRMSRKPNPAGSEVGERYTRQPR